MGTVWRARDEVMGREVAVKEPRLPSAVDPARQRRAFARMRREATAAARIDHPAVITLHDLVLEDGRPWLVMELVRGGSLEQLLANGPLDRAEAARIGLGVLDALDAAHRAGVLHRDVKPANVLLGPYGRVVLTDFGIARVEGEQALTDTGAFIGSPEFVAPELALGERPGPGADLWSLGVLLYMATEGASPFRRDQLAATIQAVISAPPRPLARGEDALGDLVLRLLSKRPAARPEPAEIRRVLQREAARGAAGGGAGGGGGGWRRRLAAGRRGRWVAGAAVGSVALVTALLVALWPDGGGALAEGGRPGLSDPTTDGQTSVVDPTDDDKDTTEADEAGDDGEDGGETAGRSADPADPDAQDADPEDPADDPDADPEDPAGAGGERPGDGAPADPDAGDGDGGWGPRDEPALAMTLSLPDGFTRDPNPNTDRQVSYRSPDGAHSIDLWYYPGFASPPRTEAEHQVAGYRADANYASVSDEIRPVDFQAGGEAVELTVLTTSASDPGAAPVLRRSLFFGGPSAGSNWQVQVTTLGAEGAGRAAGDQLYETFLSQLRFAL
ncbi:serine/threonine-protein kinase [Streptomyces sp. DSM 44915]|uniref:non-specific serine/threonine protein kinase n=2 Tax=Streptomyces chisholmiae TaxID=3075540 RepID=A0ABU2JS66_9ACTN|nr:serine/threonine-protein kinase [Streptomyces sp. DSM 44915]MDT0267815.1 serine/threonine-protein kinase [Streptomyces sp. DSM 44915]